MASDNKVLSAVARAAEARRKLLEDDKGASGGSIGSAIGGVVGGIAGTFAGGNTAAGAALGAAAGGAIGGAADGADMDEGLTTVLGGITKGATELGKTDGGEMGAFEKWLSGRERMAGAERFAEGIQGPARYMLGPGTF